MDKDAWSTFFSVPSSKEDAFFRTQRQFETMTNSVCQKTKTKKKTHNEARTRE
jgi:hypothetical protein